MVDLHEVFLDHTATQEPAKAVVSLPSARELERNRAARMMARAMLPEIGTAAMQPAHGEDLQLDGMVFPFD